MPEEREAKHQRANSDVRGIRPSPPENLRHADISVLISIDERISDLVGVERGGDESSCLLTFRVSKTDLSIYTGRFTAFSIIEPQSHGFYKAI